MRKDPNNKNKRVGYVLLPLFIEDNRGETDKEAIEATCFDEIWDVLTSLKEFDPILAKIIDKMSDDRGRRVDYDPFDRLKDKIEIIGLNVCSKVSVTATTQGTITNGPCNLKYYHRNNGIIILGVAHVDY